MDAPFAVLPFFFLQEFMYGTLPVDLGGRIPLLDFILDVVEVFLVQPFQAPDVLRPYEDRHHLEGMVGGPHILFPFEQDPFVGDVKILVHVFLIIQKIKPALLLCQFKLSFRIEDVFHTAVQKIKNEQ